VVLKNSRFFSHSTKAKKHTKIENPKHFFYGFKKTVVFPPFPSFLPKRALLLFSLAKEHSTNKDVSQREEKEEILFIEEEDFFAQSRVWNGRGFYFSFVEFFFFFAEAKTQKHHRSGDDATSWCWGNPGPRLIVVVVVVIIFLVFEEERERASPPLRTTTRKEKTTWRR